MKKNNILVVSAHAADFCSRSGGTIAKYSKSGNKVNIIDMTFGERGESEYYWTEHQGSTIDECKIQRKSEAMEAAKLLGAEIDFFDYDDYPLIMTQERIRELAIRIKDIRPNIVLTHWPKDPFNVDHEITSSAVIRAISCASVQGIQIGVPSHPIPDIFFFESSVPNTEFNDFKIDTYIDISETFEIKMEAIKRFSSQPHLIDSYTRYGLQRGVQASDWSKRQIKFAEGFKRFIPWVGDYFPLIER